MAEWKERIAENPANGDRILALDTDEFLKVMLRWLNAFVSKPGQTIPGVEDEMFDNIKVPTLIIRGGENDWDHPKRTSLEVSCLIKGSKLIDPPWPEDAWERAGEKIAPRARSSDSTCSTRGCRPRPAILKFLDGHELAAMTQRAMSVTPCGCAPRSSARPPAPCVCGSPGCAPGRPCAASRRRRPSPSSPGMRLDLAGEAEAGQHAVGIVVGSPADVGEDSGAGRGAERPGAQLNRVALQLVGFVAGDQQLDLPAVAGIAARSFSTTSMPAGAARSRSVAMPSLNWAGVSCAGRVDVDTHHRSPHGRQPIREQEVDRS